MLNSLHRRPRSRRFAPALAAVTGGRVAGMPPVPGAAPAAEPSDIVAALRAHVPSGYAHEAGLITRALIDRLEDGDRELVLAAADEEWRAYFHAAGETEKQHLVFHYAAHWDVEPVLSRVGLPRLVPPDEIHAMARGPLAAGGGLWFADVVADAADRTGVPIAAGQRVLDFGCSSGRVLSALSAWRHDVEWMGCDPNAAAAAWADAHLPHVTAFASPQEPPLDLETASLDLVYAISVWSHFGESQAVAWLEEMRRVVRPGGALIITTQGVASVAHYLRQASVTEDYARAATSALLSDGHAYFPAFGEDGDWGVKHPEWGMGFMTADWLASRATPGWSLALLEPARIDANQDLAVLVRSGEREAA